MTLMPADGHVHSEWSWDAHNGSMERTCGGRAVTFGSDAHTPSALAYAFAEAVAMVEAHGFRPGRDHYDTWIS